MNKKRFFEVEKAQAMVEFALVLPILLLVILGIIGFGHLFFCYSATVAASREAARYGAAVGVSGSSFRYQDCDGIRAAAVRAGLFAGVANTEASVDIRYDEGPGTATFGSCPVGGTGPDVDLGDRIIITVVVPYRSIVPLVNIPSFNLAATTRRTIVKSLQIGDAPTAEAVCPGTHIDMTIMGEPSEDHTTHSVVGQQVSFHLEVHPDYAGIPDPTTAESLFFNDSTSEIPRDPPFPDAPLPPYDAPDNHNRDVTYTYWKAGEYRISANYVGDLDGSPCYDDSQLPNQAHIVDAAPTSLVINAPVGKAEYSSPPGGIPIPVSISLRAVAPGVRASWEGVTVLVSSAQAEEPRTCTATLDATGDGSCSLSFLYPGAGRRLRVAIDADYAGDENYQLSDAEDVNITIIGMNPTLVPSSTPVPTSTPEPIQCPFYAGSSIRQSGTSLSFQITNPSGEVVNVTSVGLTWPSDPIAKLDELRFDWNYTGSSCDAHPHAPNCFFNAQDPTTRILPPSYSQSSITNGGMSAGYTYTMLFDFDYDLTTVMGAYRITVGFDHSCPSLVIDYTR